MTLLPLLASAALVVYDASQALTGVCTTGGIFAVEGQWNLSPYGSFEIEFDVSAEPTGAIWYDIAFESTGGRFLTKAFVTAPTNRIVRPIPPAFPVFQSCVARLERVDVAGLFDHLWPSPYWFGRDAGWGNQITEWTLDPTHVTRLSISKTIGEKSTGVKVRRIVATGAPNKAVQPLPTFATIPPKKFFPFMDRFGQFKFREWPGKVLSEADLTASLAREDADLAAHPAPASFDKWGGWKEGPRFAATGHFYVKKVEGKWWFVDPDGFLWWSHGPVRVSPSCGMTPLDGNRRSYFEELPAADSPLAAFYKTRDELLWPYYEKHGRTNTYDFTSANLYRKYGADWVTKWADRAHRRLKSWGANTIANSSDSRVMRLSRTPYCDRFEIKSRSLESMRQTKGWWPVRDPFDASFRADVRRQLLLHKAELDDPWCFGFFVDNELPWGTAEKLGRNVWACPENQPAKVAFRAWLKAQTDGERAEPTSADCAAFATVVVEEYFKVIRTEFKAVAPQKLYLGCRFSGGHPFVIRACAKYADVMSFNYYRRDLSGFNLVPKEIDKPLIIGEFHFGSINRGPFNPGLTPMKDQAERAEVYKQYLVSALKDPRFVGVHWHQWSDDVSTGRFDGENFQIGWVDICDNPYPETIAAVRWVGANMYRIRQGTSAKMTLAHCDLDHDLSKFDKPNADFVGLIDVDWHAHRSGCVAQAEALAEKFGYISSYTTDHFLFETPDEQHGVAILSHEAPKSRHITKLPTTGKGKVFFVCEFTDCYIGVTEYDPACREESLAIISNAVAALPAKKPFYLADHDQVIELETPVLPEPAIVPRPVELKLNPGQYAVHRREIGPEDVARSVDESLPKEGYRLSVRPEGISLAASDDAGAFYALQTLRQLAVRRWGALYLPCCEIKDFPRFGWRGLLMDESRHFYGKEAVKLMLEAMADHKLNVFHWHLADDEGWRIPLPGLGVSNVGYTKEDIREIVSFAKAHQIRIVPEFDLPGHARALVQAKPELACFPNGVGAPANGVDNVICPGKDATVAYLKTIVDVLAELFPDSDCIHLGGDEANKVNWAVCPHCQKRMASVGAKDVRELQAWLTRELAATVAAKGRRLVGWTEILYGGMAPEGSVLMSWLGAEGGIAAAKAGRDSVMCPHEWCYFNYEQCLEEDPFTYPWWSYPLSLARAYAYDPLAGMPEAARRHVLGGQCCLWSNQIHSEPELHWKAWPRACATAEIFWTPAELRDTPDFLRRAAASRKRLISKHINSAPTR